jgi:hypothetical protein
LPDADGRVPGSGRLPRRVRLQTRFLLYFTSLVVAVMAFTILLSLPADAAARPAS